MIYLRKESFHYFTIEYIASGEVVIYTLYQAEIASFY